MKVFGKCILAGEHAVVRGRKALVTPLFSRALELNAVRSEGSGFAVKPGPFAAALKSAIEKALPLAPMPAGHWDFAVESDIPTRAGLGSSAALSVAVARFFSPPQIFPLALELENIFHGTSSGIDLAAVMSNGPIMFRRGEAPENILVKWRPKFYLADTGLRSSTRACVEKVSAMHRDDLDDQMERSALAMEKCLASGEERLPELILAMENAAQVFREWKLVPQSVEEEISQLKKRGALAVKPTGSGDGGFLLTLWGKKPEGLIPIWDS